MILCIYGVVCCISGSCYGKKYQGSCIFVSSPELLALNIYQFFTDITIAWTFLFLSYFQGNSIRDFLIWNLFVHFRSHAVVLSTESAERLFEAVRKFEQEYSQNDPSVAAEQISLCKEKTSRNKGTVSSEKQGLRITGLWFIRIGLASPDFPEATLSFYRL